MESHITNLGGLMGNFQSLEMIIRAYLQSLPSAKEIGVDYGTDIWKLPVGTKLPESDITNYDSLGLLIDKFNSIMKTKGVKLIDKSIVDIRDAIAHGKIAADENGGTLRLLKFSKPKNGFVEITFSELMTDEWFTLQKSRVREAVLYVDKQYER